MTAFNRASNSTFIMRKAAPVVPWAVLAYSPMECKSRMSLVQSFRLTISLALRVLAYLEATPHTYFFQLETTMLNRMRQLAATSEQPARSTLRSSSRNLCSFPAVWIIRTPASLTTCPLADHRTVICLLQMLIQWASMKDLRNFGMAQWRHHWQRANSMPRTTGHQATDNKATRY